MPNAEKEFFEYLENLDMSDIIVYGFENGEFVVPNEPLLTIEGTLDKVQLVETTLLNLTNYPTLIASYTFKLRKIFPDKILIEDGSIFGQSPYGALLGAKYAFIASVDKTTNILASKNYDFPLFVKYPDVDDMLLSEMSDEDFNIDSKNLLNKIKEEYKEEYEKLSVKIKKRILPLILINNLNTDSTYVFEIKEKSNLQEELRVFQIVSKYLSLLYEGQGKIILYLNYNESLEDLEDISNSASKEIPILIYIRYNPNYDDSLYIKKSEFYQGVILGAEFIVSNTQPALGMVYKINEIEGRPCIKFSDEKGKQTIPGFKSILRLYDDNNIPIADFLCLTDELKQFIGRNSILA